MTEQQPTLEEEIKKFFPDSTKRQEYLSRFNSKAIPKCNKCNSSNFVVPSSRGRPSSQVISDASAGYVYLSGCCHSADGYCVKCKNVINLR